MIKESSGVVEKLNQIAELLFNDEFELAKKYN
jgi:hypothetical protein